MIVFILESYFWGILKVLNQKFGIASKRDWNFMSLATKESQLAFQEDIFFWNLAIIDSQNSPKFPPESQGHRKISLEGIQFPFLLK